MALWVAGMVASTLIIGSVIAPRNAWAASNVANSRHNLSVSGPGPVKSRTVTEVCVFCHTPHSPIADAPLWNHTLPSGQIYSLYSSTSLDAEPDQPTGKSLLCLACHDGTVALGSLSSPPAGKIKDAVLQKPLGLTNRFVLGTDLSDDHPISFVYDATLASRDGQLINPSDTGLPLDEERVECTTCHDPHEKDIEPFLRTSSFGSAMCIQCHDLSGWLASSHATSSAIWNKVGNNPWNDRKPEWRGEKVSDNGCLNCHAVHNAASSARLPKLVEENTCYACHNGNTASDIKTDMARPGSHPVNVTPNPDHDFTPLEDPQTMNIHAECEDCHNPHKVQADDPMISFNPLNLLAPTTRAPLANNRIRDVPGIDINGNPVNTVTNQYELCFKCHGLPNMGPCGSLLTTYRCSTATDWSMIREDAVYNIRDKVNPSAVGIVSYHPLAANNPANNGEVPSLRTDIPLDKVNSLIYCTDCHNSDNSAAAGGTGANGPHGSGNESILAQSYSLDPTLLINSNIDAALCFKCHSEAAILTTSLSGFPHQSHVDTHSKSCINCHDPHGSHRNNHLINFQTNSNFSGIPYQITPVGNNTEPLFKDLGTYTGSCSLNCHGSSHIDESY